jgi:hypothetical protein
MAYKAIKVGTVTWVDSTKGAFIEDLSREEAVKHVKQSFSPAKQVFVPTELIKDVVLKVGQMVRYEEEDNVATRVEPLA